MIPYSEESVESVWIQDLSGTILAGVRGCWEFPESSLGGLHLSARLSTTRAKNGWGISLGIHGNGDLKSFRQGSFFKDFVEYNGEPCCMLRPCGFQEICLFCGGLQVSRISTAIARYVLWDAMVAEREVFQDTVQRRAFKRRANPQQEG
jgi:hypothetical protein